MKKHISKRWLNKKVENILTLFSGATFSDHEGFVKYLNTALRILAREVEEEMNRELYAETHAGTTNPPSPSKK